MNTNEWYDWVSSDDGHQTATTTEARPRYQQQKHTISRPHESRSSSQSQWIRNTTPTIFNLRLQRSHQTVGGKR